MKKQLLKTILSALVITALPIGITSAFADGTKDITSAGSDTSEVSVDINETYKVTIPNDYTFTNITKGTGIEYVTKNVVVDAATLSLTPGNYIHVAFGLPTSGDQNPDAYKLTHDTAQAPKPTMNFEIYSDEAGTTIEHGHKEINATNGASTELTKPCNVGIDKSTIPAAGSYTGHLTFTVSVDTSAT